MLRLPPSHSPGQKPGEQPILSKNTTHPKAPRPRPPFWWPMPIELDVRVRHPVVVRCLQWVQGWAGHVGSCSFCKRRGERERTRGRVGTLASMCHCASPTPVARWTDRIISYIADGATKPETRFVFSPPPPLLTRIRSATPVWHCPSLLRAPGSRSRPRCSRSRSSTSSTTSTAGSSPGPAPPSRAASGIRQNARTPSRSVLARGHRRGGGVSSL